MSSATRVWMPFYTKEYRDATRRLTLAERGAYTDLICEYWANGPLPDDDSVLARILGVPKRDWLKVKPAVMAFFRMEEGAWRHKRIDKELEDGAKRNTKASTRASTAAKARWTKHERAAPPDARSNAPSINGGCLEHASSITEAVLEECQPQSQSQSTSLRSVDETGVSARRRASPLALDRVRQAQIASLMEELMAAAGEALADFAVCTGLIHPAAILRLLEPSAGEPCDLTLDVLPAIREVCAGRPPRSITSWSYLEKPILRRRDQRLAGLPLPTKAEMIINERAHPHSGHAPNGRAAARSVWAEIAAEEDAARAGRGG